MWGREVQRRFSLTPDGIPDFRGDPNSCESCFIVDFLEGIDEFMLCVWKPRAPLGEQVFKSAFVLSTNNEYFKLYEIKQQTSVVN